MAFKIHYLSGQRVNCYGKRKHLQIKVTFMMLVKCITKTYTITKLVMY